jgi:3-hydroxyisobutyrate dehydrogenase
MRVAFLGLGIMGAGMAANLVKKGHEVTTWNRSRGKQVEGASSSDSPKAAAEGAEVVWICVSDTAAVHDVLFGPNGAAESLRPGMIVADSSTISPVESQSFAERVRAKGAEFVDAPVTGSKIGAKDGTLIFIAGGKKETVERLGPLFQAMGKQVIHVGDNGKGEAAKLAMNLMIVLIYEGFIEAMTLAKNLGVDQKALFSLIQASMVRSGVVDYKITRCPSSSNATSRRISPCGSCTRTSYLCLRPRRLPAPSYRGWRRSRKCMTRPPRQD